MTLARRQAGYSVPRRSPPSCAGQWIPEEEIRRRAPPLLLAIPFAATLARSRKLGFWAHRRGPSHSRVLRMLRPWHLSRNRRGRRAPVARLRADSPWRFLCWLWVSLRPLAAGAPLLPIYSFFLICITSRRNASRASRNFCFLAGARTAQSSSPSRAGAACGASIFTYRATVSQPARRARHSPPPTSPYAPVPWLNAHLRPRDRVASDRKRATSLTIFERCRAFTASERVMFFSSCYRRLRNRGRATRTRFHGRDRRSAQP